MIGRATTGVRPRVGAGSYDYDIGRAFVTDIIAVGTSSDHVNMIWVQQRMREGAVYSGHFKLDVGQESEPRCGYNVKG